MAVYPDSRAAATPAVEPAWLVCPKPAEARLLRWAIIILLCALAFTLTGCGRMQPAAPQDNHRVTLEAQPGQPVVGVGTFAITILDPAGKPVEGAQLTVEGNMSHAGMIPSAGTVVASQGGRYTIALDWTMAGAWYVDVKATLPDGRSIVRRFPVNVRAAK